MRRPALLAILAFCAPAGADPLPAHAPRIADYDIRVKLDADAKTLAGSEHVTWRNPASEPVGELWFHLYLNAFKNSESTFFKESGGQLRGDRMPDEGWGFIDVTSIRGKDGVDLTGGARFEQPDDGNEADRTVWRVPLPRAGAGRRHDRARRRVHREAAARFRAHRLLPRLLPRRAVVPEARRLRAGRRRAAGRRPAGTATSSTPTRSSTPTSEATASRSRRRKAT